MPLDPQVETCLLTLHICGLLPFQWHSRHAVVRHSIPPEMEGSGIPGENRKHNDSDSNKIPLKFYTCLEGL